MKEPIIRLWKKFVEDRQYLKNVSQNTLDAYGFAWNAWATALPKHAAEIGPDTVLECVIAMKKRTWRHRVGTAADGTGLYEALPLTDITMDSYLRVLRSFFNWMHERSYLPKAVKVARMKCEDKVMRVFTGDELDAILGYKAVGKKAIRIGLLSAIILDTGLRATEALTLKVEDIDLDGQFAVVKKPKGRKQRIVPLSRKLCFLLKPWLKEPQAYLFATRTGRPLSYRNALRAFQHACGKLKISGARASFHTLRSTFATNYWRASGDVLKLQRIMGHSTLAMTQRYVSQSTQDLVRDHDRVSPLTMRRK